MFKIIEDYEKRVKNEVVRVPSSDKQNSTEKNCGKTASFLLKALILEDKAVYLKYLAEAKDTKDLANNAIAILRIAQRMLNEGLATVCGSPDRVPEKYRGKKLAIFAGMPYNKMSELTIIKVDENGNRVKVPNYITQKDGTVIKEAKVTIIKLYLAVEE